MMPPRREETGLRQRDDGGLVNDLDLEVNELDMARKVLAVGSPPGRHGSFHPLKDDGGGLKHLDLVRGPEERDSDERTMGWGVKGLDLRGEKLSL